MSTLLQEIKIQDAARLETERKCLLNALQRELTALLPAGEPVWVFGSLADPGRFSDASDIDIAIAHRPVKFSEFWLQGELELRLGRRVDVVVLGETRLREKIEREGRRWTL